MTINPGISRRLQWVVSLLFAGAVLVIVPLALPWLVKLALLIVLVGSYVCVAINQGWFPLTPRYPFIRKLLFIHEPFQQLNWQSDGLWVLTDKYGRVFNAELLASTFVSRWLVVLDLRLHVQPWQSRNRSLVLLPDSIHTDEFRRLRVRLLTGKLVRQDTGFPF